MPCAAQSRMKQRISYRNNKGKLTSLILSVWAAVTIMYQLTNTISAKSRRTQGSTFAHNRAHFRQLNLYGGEESSSQIQEYK